MGMSNLIFDSSAIRACCPNARRGKQASDGFKTPWKFDQNRTFRVAVAEDGHTPGFGQHALSVAGSERLTV